LVHVQANPEENEFELGSRFAARFILNPSLYKYANQLASFRGRECEGFSGDFVGNMNLGFSIARGRWR
jgi:hypothetical protein